MPLYVCRDPDCNATLPEPGRCLKHRRRDLRSSAYHRGYGPKWQRFSIAFLKARPYCEGMQAEGEPELHDSKCEGKATEAHHLDGKGPSGPRGFDRSNLRPVSRPCHKAITARDQPGGFAA